MQVTYNNYTSDSQCGNSCDAGGPIESILSDHRQAVSGSGRAGVVEDRKRVLAASGGVPMNAQSSYSDSDDPLRPLTGGRYRTREVEAQIRWIRRMPFREACLRIAEKDAAGAPLIKEEALVYLLRDYNRRGCA